LRTVEHDIGAVCELHGELGGGRVRRAHAEADDVERAPARARGKEPREALAHRRGLAPVVQRPRALAPRAADEGRLLDARHVARRRAREEGRGPRGDALERAVRDELGGQRLELARRAVAKDDRVGAHELGVLGDERVEARARGGRGGRAAGERARGGGHVGRGGGGAEKASAERARGVGWPR